jgi:hypothetical protein
MDHIAGREQVERRVAPCTDARWAPGGGHLDELIDLRIHGRELQFGLSAGKRAHDSMRIEPRMSAPPPAQRIEADFFRALNALVEPAVHAGCGSPGLLPTGLIVLETTGAKSGQPRRVPLLAGLRWLRLHRHRARRALALGAQSRRRAARATGSRDASTAGSRGSSIREAPCPPLTGCRPSPAPWRTGSCRPPHCAAGPSPSSSRSDMIDWLTRRFL